MNYETYLFSKLLEHFNYEFSIMSYDEQFYLAQDLYQIFEDSEYNKESMPLYECIVAYLQDTEINLKD